MSGYYLYIGLVLFVVALAQLGAEWGERRQLARKQERRLELKAALKQRSRDGFDREALKRARGEWNDAA